MDLYIDDRQDKIEVDEEVIKLMKEAIETSLIREKGDSDYEISLSLVDNDEIHELNRDYRGVDRETDVLSFPLEDEFGLMDMAILGDIIISVEKAQEQAEDFGHSLKREMVYLAIHSVFHLMGYDHIDEDDKKLMRAKEKEVIKAMGVFK